MDSMLDGDTARRCNFYQLLGCDVNSSTEQILAEYKLLAREHHPDKNPADSDLSTERFKKLQEAKEVLTDVEQRRDYDRWMHSGLVISYDSWRSVNDSVKTTMHWASIPKKPKNMLLATESEAGEGQLTPDVERKRKCAQGRKGESQGYVVGNIVWQRQNDGNDLLRKFRNYEI